MTNPHQLDGDYRPDGVPTKSFHNPCPYGNDDCPKCKPTPQAKDEGLRAQILDLHRNIIVNNETPASITDKIMALFAQHTKAAVLAGQQQILDRLNGVFDDELRSEVNSLLAKLQAQQQNLTKDTK